MKSAGKDLAQAEQQALDYIDSLPDAEMPQFVLTCDFQWFRLLDIELAEGQDSVIEFPPADFPKQARLLASVVCVGCVGSANSRAPRQTEETGSGQAI